MRKGIKSLSLYIPHEAMRFSGFRAMLEVAEKGSFMYGALGMYMFSHGVWLAKEMQRGGFDRIVFIARDGYWVKRAYDVVAPALGVDVPSDYVRISRKAAFPLHFRMAEDLVDIAEWIDVTSHTERSLMRLLATDLREGAADAANDTRLLTAADIPAFVSRCSELWDTARAAAYREHARAYIAPKFTGKCATFDVGYNLRSESVIRDLTGADITAFITHTDSDVPDRRGVPYQTLYPVSPWVSWAVRERFLLEDAPLCVGYDEKGPVLEAVQDADVPIHMRAFPNLLVSPQRVAEIFVNDMFDVYGERLKELHFRPQDGCAPFEWFLHCCDWWEMKACSCKDMENDFHAGAKGEDSFCLQWRLMQTDLLLARGVPRWRVKLKRAFIRLQEEPGRTLRRLNPFATD